MMKTGQTAEGRGQMLVIFRDMAEGLNKLDADERHKIVDAVLGWYAGDGDATEGLAPSAAFIVQVICDKQRSYEAVCRMRREVGSKGGKAKRRKRLLHFAQAKPTSMSTSTSVSTSMSKSSNTHICVRPTIEEVRDYCRERGNKVDAQAWYDYYESNGWRVGRNAMKDWRAAVRTWERNGVGAAKAKATHGDNYIGATENQIKEFSDGFAA